MNLVIPCRENRVELVLQPSSVFTQFVVRPHRFASLNGILFPSFYLLRPCLTYCFVVSGQESARYIESLKNRGRGRGRRGRRTLNDFVKNEDRGRFGG